MNGNTYYDSVSGQDLDTIKDDPNFQADLVRFFNSGRYNMSPSEIEEAGVDGLYEKYLDHMRFQEVNEATALQDLFFVKDGKNNSRDSIESFGRLVTAWDNSGSAGDGFAPKAWDYFKATVTSPSFVAGAAAAGVGGPVAKVGSFAANKATQITLRQALTKFTAKEIAKNGLKRAAVVGAARGAATEGALALGHETMLEEVRDESIEGYETDKTDFWLSVGLQATVGGAVGAGSRAYYMKEQNKALDLLKGHHEKWLQAEKTAKANTKKVLDASKNTDIGKEALDQMETLVRMKEATQKGTTLDPLDPEQVLRGQSIKEQILSGEGVRAGMSMADLQKLAAAGIELSENLGRRKGERITSAMARAIDEGTLDPNLASIKKTYNLTNSQVSDLFMADVSEAGRILQAQGQVSKAMKAKGLESIEAQIKALSAKGVPVPGEEEMAKVAKALDQENHTSYNFLRELDSMRIGFLTSQPATTVANFLSQTVRLGVDASDQVFKNIYRSIHTRGMVNPLRGAFSAIRNTTSPHNAQALRILTDEQAPDLARKIYFDASRVENATGGQSRMAKLTRGINIANTLVDSTFKQGIFYASLDRQLMELNNPRLGRNALEFLKNGTSLDDLPEEMLKRIETDTLGFVYQKGFKGENNLYGKVADTVITTHREVPFTVSSIIPFPRYIANQIEFVHDYTPFVGMIGIAMDKARLAKTGVGRTATKDMSDRVARQATGIMAMMGAYYIRSTQEGKTEPLAITGPDGSDLSIERPGGPHNTHLVIMDAVYRWNNGLPTPKLDETVKAAIEAASGLSVEGYGASVSEELLKSLSQGEWTEGFNRWAGDLASTMTFPLVVVNDVMSQLNPERADKPYTRDIFGEDVSVFDLIKVDAEMANRATRFLWDTESIQYLQSFDGKTDVPLYNPFNDRGPVRTLNPLLKQITSTERKPALTSLQKEMRLLGIKEWDVYGSRKVENAAVDEAVRRQLSRTLSQKFFEFRDKPAYKENEDPEQKRVLLKGWLSREVQAAQEEAENAFIALGEADPKLATGFIRNQYEIKKKEATTGFDSVVQIYTGGEFESVDDYLYPEGLEGDEAIRTELTRKQQIMNWSAREEKALNEANK